MSTEQEIIPDPKYAPPYPQSFYPFWPRHAFRAGALIAGVLLGLLILSFAIRVPMDPAMPPLPDAGMYVPSPEWYLFLLFQPFWYLTGDHARWLPLATFWLPMLLLAFLFLVPVVFRRRQSDTQVSMGASAKAKLLAVVAAFLQNFYPFALAGMLGGALMWGVCEGLVRYWPRLERPWLHCGTLALGIALLVSLLVRETRHREHLPLQPIHQQVANWLDEHGESDAMIVTPYWDVNWLGKIRHPMLADYQTAHLMSYVPALAPALKKMHAEVFGFVVDGETGPPLAEWPGRSVEEWRRLGEAYGFRYVLAPTEMKLTLERVLEGQPYDLYRVGP